MAQAHRQNFIFTSYLDFNDFEYCFFPDSGNVTVRGYRERLKTSSQRGTSLPQWVLRYRSTSLRDARVLYCGAQRSQEEERN